MPICCKGTFTSLKYSYLAWRFERGKLSDTYEYMLRFETLFSVDDQCIIMYTCKLIHYKTYDIKCKVLYMVLSYFIDVYIYKGGGGFGDKPI